MTTETSLFVAPRTAAVLAAVTMIYGMNGRVTIREIADHLGVSTSTVHIALVQLKADGMVTWTPGSHVTLRPTCEPVAV